MHNDYIRAVHKDMFLIGKQKIKNYNREMNIITKNGKKNYTKTTID